MLPNDVARCPGNDWDPFGVQPECIDCQRRTDPGTSKYMTYTDPPKEDPCPSRIGPNER